MYTQTYIQVDKQILPVFYWISFPSGPLPKRGGVNIIAGSKKLGNRAYPKAFGPQLEIIYLIFFDY